MAETMGDARDITKEIPSFSEPHASWSIDISNFIRLMETFQDLVKNSIEDAKKKTQVSNGLLPREIFITLWNQVQELVLFHMYHISKLSMQVGI